MAFNFFSSLFNRKRSKSQSKVKTSRKQLRRQMSLETLEGRELNAIDVTLTGEGLLRIVGDEQHNYADVMQVDDHLEVYTTRNRLDDVPDAAIIHSFPTNAVKQIFFDGKAGDDFFINRLQLPSMAYGGEGDDMFRGATGRNEFYGEGGDDVIEAYGTIQRATPFANKLHGPQDQSPVAIYYRQLNGAATILGQPTNGGEEFASLDGQAKMRTYENGVIVWTAGNGAVHVVGDVLKKWESLGGFNNPIVGNPTTNEALFSTENVSVTSDTFQKFEYGLIMHRPTVGNGTFEVHGEIYKKWTQPGDAKSKGTLGLVGLPRSDEMPTISGNGRVSTFDRGSIIWTRATNTTKVVRSDFSNLFNPGTALNNRLLFLTSVAPASLGGMTMSTATNDFYTKLGREAGALGPQVAAEKLIGSKMVFVTQFKFGAIYRTMNSTFEVHGDIYKKYVQLGGPAGLLGLPRTNETAVGDAAGGRFNTFEYGVILWTPARGAFELHGDIWQTWSSQGGVKSSLGYPTSDEHDVSVNSDFRLSNFQNGAISWSPRTGSILLQGSAWKQWMGNGAEKSFLGAPSGRSFPITVNVGGSILPAQRTEFEGGTMITRTGSTTFDFNFAQMKFALKQISVEGTTVTQSELNLMRSFLTAPNSMPPSVANLLGKVINGDPANTTYRQTFLGNLSANSPNSQLVKLVDKWFGGGERPLARNKFGEMLTYQYADGVLFGPQGPLLSDIDQGSLGDCYLMASLASVAARNPQAIRDMIVDNGDDTYTVRFFNAGQAEYVTVDRYLPTNSDGDLVYALGGRAAALSAEQAAVSPLWFALIEKAYVIAASSGWMEEQARNNDYGGEKGGEGGIVGGSASGALSHILGYEVEDNYTGVEGYADGSPSEIVDYRNEIIAAGNKYSLFSTPEKAVTSSKLFKNHVYVILAADDQGLTLFNPHGAPTPVVNISWDELRFNISHWTHY